MSLTCNCIGILSSNLGIIFKDWPEDHTKRIAVLLSISIRLQDVKGMSFY